MDGGSTADPASIAAPRALTASCAASASASAGALLATVPALAGIHLQRCSSGIWHLHAQPSRLDQLMKLSPLLEQSPEEIQHIWLQYHADEAPGSSGRVASVQTAEEYATFRSRAQASPLFVLPLKKDGDGYVTLVLQCQLPFVLFTTLEEYRSKGSAAPPHLTLVHYAELEVAKGLVLVRGDIITDSLISAPEARTLMELVRALYTDAEGYKLVHTFNHNPAQFDFSELLHQLDPKNST